MLEDIVKMDLKTTLTTLPNIPINSYKKWWRYVEMVEFWYKWQWSL